MRLGPGQVFLVFMRLLHHGPEQFGRITASILILHRVYFVITHPYSPEYNGVSPQNQQSLLFSDVPVLPPVGTPGTLPLVPVPLLATVCSMLFISQAVSALMARFICCLYA